MERASPFSSANAISAAGSNQGNLRRDPSWPLVTRTRNEGANSNNTPHQMPTTGRPHNPSPLLTVANPSQTHIRQTSVQMLGIPRREDPELHQEEAEAVSAPNNTGNRSGRMVFRENSTGKLYRCENLVEITRSNHHGRRGRDQVRAQAQGEAQDQAQGTPPVPIVQLENSDGTFTLLDAAASSTDTIVTPFPGPGMHGSNSGRFSSRRRSPPAREQRRDYCKIFQNSHGKLLALVVLTLAGLPSLSASLATVMEFKAEDRPVPNGIVAWFILSIVLTAAAITIAISVYLDYRKAKIANGRVMREEYELEELRNFTGHPSIADLRRAQNNNANQNESPVQNKEHQDHFRDNGRANEGNNATLNGSDLMLRAVEQASSRIAMPATTLSRTRGREILAEMDGLQRPVDPSQRTIHPALRTLRHSAAAQDLSHLPIAASMTNSSIITALCAGVAEPYSPLGNNRARRNDTSPQEPESRCGCDGQVPRRF